MAKNWGEIHMCNQQSNLPLLVRVPIILKVPDIEGIARMNFGLFRIVYPSPIPIGHFETFLEHFRNAYQSKIILN